MGDMSRIAGWTTQCVDCHDPHFQEQLHWYQEHADSLFLVRGRIAAADQPVVAPFAPTTPWQAGINAFCLACHADGTPNDPGWPAGVWGPGYYRNHTPGTLCDADGDGLLDSGYVWDCRDRCIVEADALSVIGDTSCNDGYSNFDLRCAAFQNDGGDCGPEPLRDGFSLLNGIDSCGAYSQAPWHNDITWSHSAHGGDSKRGWSGYVQDPPAPAYELECVACHDPHGSATATNPAGNPYLIRDYVDSTPFIDDGSRPGNHYQSPGTAGEVVIPVSADGPAMASLCEKCHADWLALVLHRLHLLSRARRRVRRQRLGGIRQATSSGAPDLLPAPTVCPPHSLRAALPQHRTSLFQRNS